MVSGLAGLVSSTYFVADGRLSITQCTWGSRGVSVSESVRVRVGDVRRGRGSAQTRAEWSGRRGAQGRERRNAPGSPRRCGAQTPPPPSPSALCGRALCTSRRRLRGAAGGQPHHGQRAFAKVSRARARWNRRPHGAGSAPILSSYIEFMMRSPIPTQREGGFSHDKARRRRLRWPHRATALPGSPPPRPPRRAGRRAAHSTRREAARGRAAVRHTRSHAERTQGAW